jgi:hypothetical protein
MLEQLHTLSAISLHIQLRLFGGMRRVCSGKLFHGCRLIIDSYTSRLRSLWNAGSVGPSAALIVGGASSTFWRYGEGGFWWAYLWLCTVNSTLIMSSWVLLRA